MKVDRYRVLLPHPYIHRVLLRDVLDTEDRVCRKNSILYSSLFVNIFVYHELLYISGEIYIMNICERERE